MGPKNLLLSFPYYYIMNKLTTNIFKILFLSTIITSAAFAGELITAIVRHDTKEVERLLENGADPNETTGITALSRAASEGFSDITELLINFNANVNLAGLMLTPLILAAAKNHSKVAKILLKAGATLNENTFEKSRDVDKIRGTILTVLKEAISDFDPGMVEIIRNCGVNMEQLRLLFQPGEEDDISFVARARSLKIKSARN